MKKTLCILLSLVLLITLIPVFAVGSHYTTETAYSGSLFEKRLNAIDLTGNYATDILNVAFSQEGYHEGDSFAEMNGYSSGSSNYTEYGYSLGLNGQPWCASFISWCARRAGIPNSVLTSSGVACAADFGAEFRYSSKYTPKPGDIIIFDWVEDGLSISAHPEAHGDHVGLVYRVSGDTVYYIDGNGSDLHGDDANDVRCHGRLLSDENIKGYGVYTDTAADISKVGRIYIYGQYTDVDETLWYGCEGQQTIKNAYELGLVSGKSIRTFAPNESLLLCEALTLAARTYSRAIGDDFLFDQSNGEFWYDCYLTYCTENGIIDPDRFSRADMFRPATRREMALIFAHALPISELTAINAVSSVPDVEPGSEAEAEILLLYNAGVLGGGDGYGTFYPEAPVKRAEATAIITREANSALRLTLSLIPLPGNETEDPVETEDHEEPAEPVEPEETETPEEPAEPVEPEEAETPEESAEPVEPEETETPEEQEEPIEPISP